jgi:hypothetical protein
MNTDTWTAVLAIATVLLAIVSLVIGCWTAFVLHRTQVDARNAKVIETLALCVKEYQSLEDQRHTLKGDRYFELLWNIHFTEFHYFKLGFLPPEIYTVWLWVRHQDYYDPQRGPLLGKTEADGWIHAKKYLKDDAFERFVESWLLSPAIDKTDIMPLLPRTK